MSRDHVVVVSTLGLLLALGCQRKEATPEDANRRPDNPEGMTGPATRRGMESPGVGAPGSGVAAERTATGGTASSAVNAGSGGGGSPSR